jgi:glycosyltransferase involved in cell wall biosynthesis
VRICYLCADLGISLGGYSGSASYIRGLVEAFAALGHEVVVIAPASEGGSDLGAKIIPLPVPAVTEAFTANTGPRVGVNEKIADRTRARLFLALRQLWNNTAVEQALRQVVSRYHPDLLYERYSPFGVAGGIVAQQLGAPHILHVNAPLAWEGARYRQQALQEAAEALESWAFDTASLIVTTCRELRDLLVADGVSEAKVTVVPCGVDVHRFTPHGPANRQGLEGKLVVGFVGSLKPWHGVDILAAAFKQLAVDPRFHLLVIGDGPLMSVLHGLREAFPQQVTLTGTVPQTAIPPYLRAMDIAVAPYPVLERFYFSPLKVFEYMATGRAVVASRIGQITELIREGETGVLVPPGDVAALVAAVRALAADQGLRQTLAAKATAAVQSAHTWLHRAARVIELAHRARSAQGAL